MFESILEESWAYKEMKQKAEKQAKEKWKQEGRQEGMIQSLLTIVEARFPALLPQVKALVEHTRDPQTLQRLLLALTLAQSVDEASHSLSNGNAR